MFLPLFFSCDFSEQLFLCFSITRAWPFEVAAAAIMGQKRGRDSKAQALESKKRKKAAKSGLVSDDDAWDGVIGIDDLNWTEVALPDRLGDATGFLGLEEIDGVDIVRSSGGGEVQFKVRTRD
jgi:ATP-dependent RNA helicase DDX24/MAK5